jgi:hypothetical protein
MVAMPFSAKFYHFYGKFLSVGCLHNLKVKQTPIKIVIHLFEYYEKYCDPLIKGIMLFLFLTFKNRASNIKDGRTATLQMLNFIFFFNNYKY